MAEITHERPRPSRRRSSGAPLEIGETTRLYLPHDRVTLRRAVALPGSMGKIGSGRPGTVIQCVPCYESGQGLVLVALDPFDAGGMRSVAGLVLHLSTLDVEPL